ncbi:MAG: hypothetical protein WD397_16895 [Wenzhouxiangellaceae bacterium]
MQARLSIIILSWEAQIQFQPQAITISNDFGWFLSKGVIFDGPAPGCISVWVLGDARGAEMVGLDAGADR